MDELFLDVDNFRNDPSYNKIETTRHYTAGHIEKSLKRYYDTIKRLESEEAARFINQFLKLLNRASFLTTDYATLAKQRQMKKNKSSNDQLNSLLEKIEDFLSKQTAANKNIASSGTDEAHHQQL